MPNALAYEKSPYLLQHAANPVDWLPWGEAAFARARSAQKPIFLSIGYSTCHWCHVMAHESFEDETIAKILNDHFVSIKVDREERPDVDKVYMAYVQAMTGHGGWPLSAWLTPQLKPFYGGTYFPPEDRHGRTGFPSILQAIARGWRDERDKLLAEGERVIETLRDYHGGRKEQGEGKQETEDKRQGTGAGGTATEGAASEKTLVEAASKAFEKGFEYFFEAFDPNNGGFGGAPKFPRASNLNFLFRIAALQGPHSEMGAEAVRLASATLRSMARGGIHDHVGGGFHRYSVDEAWFVPHFEKMLYDQAQIAWNCLEAKQATGDERFAWMARDIFDYVARDLTSPAGGFYTAEDADSALPGGSASGEGGGRGTSDRHAHAEGAFYVWTAGELRTVLGDDFAFVAAHFGVEEAGNVPAQLDPQGELRGKNILAQRRSLADTAMLFSVTPEQANDRLLLALARLRGVRAQRPRPQLDDKILTANNGLMISALAKAHQVIGSAEALHPEWSEESLATSDSLPPGGGPYLQAATRAAEFIERELYDPARGVLFRAWREGRGTVEGFAEDYAFFIQALLDLYEASFEIRWLQWAERLQATMDELFWDDARGGYFNSAADDPSIVLRLKEDYDGAEPAPSSVAAMNLLRLGGIFENGAEAASQQPDAPRAPQRPDYRERGRRTIEAFRDQWSRAAHAMPQILCALELALEPPRHVVLAGDPQAEDFRALAAVLHESIGHRRSVLAADGGEAQAWIARRAPWLAGMKMIDGRATAYVCEEFACQAPVSDATGLRSLLR